MWYHTWARGLRLTRGLHFGLFTKGFKNFSDQGSSLNKMSWFGPGVGRRPKNFFIVFAKICLKNSQKSQILARGRQIFSKIKPGVGSFWIDHGWVDFCYSDQGWPPPRPPLAHLWFIPIICLRYFDAIFACGGFDVHPWSLFLSEFYDRFPICMIGEK